MAKSYEKQLDEIYGVSRNINMDGRIPSRHLGFFPADEPEVDVPTAQQRYIKELARNVKEGDYVLDIGCAFGETAVWLAKNLNCRVLGIDIVDSQIEGAKEFARRLGVEDKVEFKTLNACEMNFPEGTFDHIISVDVIVHIPEKHKVFEQAFKALKPGGKISISDPIFGDKSSWFTRTVTSWVTLKSYMIPVKQYCGVIEEAGFKNIETLDVTETAYINTWNVSKKENYHTILEAFGRDIWGNPFVLNIMRTLAMPGLKKRKWGWYFFWAEK